MGGSKHTGSSPELGIANPHFNFIWKFVLTVRARDVKATGVGAGEGGMIDITLMNKYQTETEM